MSWLKRCTSNFTSVIENGGCKNSYVHLDLSIENKELDLVDISTSIGVQNYIDDLYLKNNASTAYGGYIEKRGIYKRSNYFNNQDKSLERNIHLGIDIWSKAGTGVLAPIDGKVHSFKNNTNFGDYGPTIILENKIGNKTFYTLYGHLSLESITSIKKGDKIKKGTRFCELGDDTVNGNYAPHLHFQVILDLQGKKGDYPGVCSLNELEFYRKNCPDPNLILKIIDGSES